SLLSSMATCHQEPTQTASCREHEVIMPKEKLIGLIFAIATALFWGMYGPALGKARTPGDSPFKPYIFIGLAYLIWGMIGGIVAVKATGGDFKFKPEA